MNNIRQIDEEYSDGSRYQALRNNKLFKNSEIEVYTKDGKITLINKYILEDLKTTLKFSEGKLSEVSFYEKGEDYITKREKQIEMKRLNIEYLENKIVIYEKAPKSYNNPLKNGIYLEYEGDKLITKGNYIDGKKEGLWQEEGKEALYKNNEKQGLVEKFKYKYKKAKTEIEIFNNPIDIIKNCNNLKNLEDKISINNWGAFEANLSYNLYHLKNIEKIISKEKIEVKTEIISKREEKDYIQEHRVEKKKIIRKTKGKEEELEL